VAAPEPVAEYTPLGYGCVVSTNQRLAAFVMLLVLAFGLGAGLGAVAGPIDVGGDQHPHTGEPHDSGTHDMDGGDMDGGAP
jgi:hypothetical protein